MFIFFAECPVSGTRQRPPLPSARSGTRQRIFFYFCSQIFSLGFLQCFKVHVKIWLNFVTFYYIFRIIFILLIYFVKSKFELQVHRIMKSNHSKNDCHASECFEAISRNLRDIFHILLTKHEDKVAAKVFLNCIKFKRIQKITKLVDASLYSMWSLW